MDEKVRFAEPTNEQIAVYNELLIYTLSSSTSFSIDRLRRAIFLILIKHPILRTAVFQDQEQLMQKVLPVQNDLCNIKTIDILNDNHLNQVLYDEETKRALFFPEQGQVFRR